MIEDITLDCAGLRLAARISGPRTGVPALCLHGWMDNSASFDPLAAALLNAGANVRLCALDLPGHGHSEHRAASARYHYVDYVVDAEAAALALGWDRYCIIGHSMGAGVATLLSCASERVDRAVLIEGIGPVSTPASEAPGVMRRALRDALQPSGGSTTVFQSLDDAVRLRLTSRVRLSEPSARLICARALRQTAQGYVWRSDRRLRQTSMLRLSPELALSFVRDMRVPTLLIAAQEGISGVYGDYQARLQAHPDLKVVSLAGSHHLHMEAEAGGVARQIAGFLVR